MRAQVCVRTYTYVLLVNGENKKHEQEQNCALKLQRLAVYFTAIKSTIWEEPRLGTPLYLPTLAYIVTGIVYGNASHSAVLDCLASVLSVGKRCHLRR